jgi:hypothetical protein
LDAQAAAAAVTNGYIHAAGIRDGGKAPLFHSAAGRTGTLTEKPMNRIDAWRMIQSIPKTDLFIAHVASSGTQSDDVDQCASVLLVSDEAFGAIHAAWRPAM